MVNENRYRYLWVMDDADEQRLYAELEAIGNERADHDAYGKKLAERAQQAAKHALEEGMKPSRVARALHYTDGYVRKLRLEANLPPDPRYAGNTPPSRAKLAPEPVIAPAAITSSPFLPPHSTAVPDEEQERLLMKALRNSQARWFKTAWQATDGLKGRERTQKILAMAVEAGHLAKD